jgi:hypothetical protein
MVRRTPFKVDSAGQKHDAGAIFIPVEAVERLRAISAMALLSLLSGLEGNSTVKGRPHLLTDDMLGRWRIPSNQRRRGFSELASRGIVTYAQQGKDFLSRISVYTHAFSDVETHPLILSRHRHWRS